MSCDLSAVYFKLLARRLARQCREIVQAFLREAEWIDAENEFAKVILSELEDSLSTPASSVASPSAPAP
jgi:hypothetical protein